MGGNLSSGVFVSVSVESRVNMLTLTPMIFERWTGAVALHRMSRCAILALLFTLVSCVATPSRDSSNSANGKPPPPPPPVVTPAETQNTAVQKADAVALEHIQKAIGKLQVGQAADAKKELDAVLLLDPGNKSARSLQAQIQTDPARYFGGQDSFSYTVQQGDTYSSIAQHFLDEPLKFFILARFNGVNDPSRIVPGRTIRVPGNKTSASPATATVTAPAPAPAASEESLTQRARHFYDAGKYQQAIETLEGSPTESGEAREVLVLAYGKYAEELLRKQNLTAAQSVFEKALTLQPENEKLRKQLKQVETQREIEIKYKTGLDAVATGDTPKAQDAFNAVLKLDPAHDGAKKQIAAIKMESVETMHKDAMVEYSKQNLDKAIDLWDRVLALLPTHKNAKLYRARAVDLKSRLLKLEQQ